MLEWYVYRTLERFHLIKLLGLQAYCMLYKNIYIVRKSSF